MDSLNTDYLRAMTPEKLEKYRQELQMVLGQTARFLEQVEQVLEERQ